jgi:hypothetical protein
MAEYRIEHKRTSDGKVVTIFDVYTITYCNDVVNHNVSEKIKISLVLYDPYRDSVLFLLNSKDIRYVSFADNAFFKDKNSSECDNSIKKHVMLNYWVYTGIPIIFKNIIPTESKVGPVTYQNTNCNNLNNIIYKYSNSYIPVKILCRAHAYIDGYNEYTYIAIAPRPIYNYNNNKCILVRKPDIKKCSSVDKILLIKLTNLDGIPDNIKKIIEKNNHVMKIVGANSFMFLLFLLFPNLGTIQTHVNR